MKRKPKRVVSWNERPQIIRDVGFDFRWEEEKVWKLRLPVKEMDIKKLVWHFDIPFWEKDGTDAYNLKPWAVIKQPKKHSHYKRAMRVDLKHPIDIMRNKGRWVILDGLHRLLKAYVQGQKKVKVRIVPRSKIPRILK